MSRIKSDKINLGTSVVLNFPEQAPKEEEVVEVLEQDPRIAQINQMEVEAKEQAQKILSLAQMQAQNRIDEAKSEADSLIQAAQSELESAKLEAQKIIDEAKAQEVQINEQAQNEAVTIKETASQEGAKQGYEAGYNDGLEQIRTELKQKIQEMDDIAQSAYEMKNKILNSAKAEIVELVLMIAKKVCINCADPHYILNVVNKSVSLLSDKENIGLVLSEKYARFFNEILDGTIAPDEILPQDEPLMQDENDADKAPQEPAPTQIDIDKLKNIKVSYNAKIADDTIIVETPKERLDAGIEAQINQIAQEFLLEFNSAKNEELEEN